MTILLVFLVIIILLFIVPFLYGYITEKIKMADERKDDNSSVVKNHHTGNTYTIHSFRFKEPNDEWVTYVYLDHGKNAKATIELILKKNGNRIEARDNNNHMGSSYVKENESLTPQLLHEKVKHFVMVSTSGNLVEDIISDL